MATPTWTAFPLTPTQRADLILACREALAQWGFRLHGVSKLTPQPDGGVDCSAETIDCDLETTALSLAEKWPGLVLTYKVLPIRDNAYLYFWNQSGRTAFGVQFGASALAFQEGPLAEGEWLEEKICALTALFQTGGSYFGNDDLILEPLDLPQILSDLRRGTFPANAKPGCLLVSRRQMEDEEARYIISRIQPRFRYYYRLLGSGYHLFSNLVRRTVP